VRQTALFFQPQIRTKIMHEGWASFWHEKLFLQDDRIQGHEVEYARVNAGVTSLPRVGLNPYALGMRLFQFIEEMADRGRYSYQFQRMRDARQRRDYDSATGGGLDFIFNISRTYCDFMFINEFVDQDFIDRHRLFVAGKRLNRSRMTWEYFIQSRDAGRYRQMLIDSLYHPPCIEIDRQRSEDGPLVLVHRFEGKPLVTEYVTNTMLGIEYLWGKSVILETTERAPASPVPEPMTTASPHAQPTEEKPPPAVKWQRVRYIMKDRQLSREVLPDE
jgi:stage V sporulation protein R